MCSIWQIQKPANLSHKALLNLSKDLRYINLTGGEPFLRQDLPEIIRITKKMSPKAQIIISTNGLAPEVIKSQMQSILKFDNKIGIRVSLDGTKKMHNQIRGQEGSFEKAITTITNLKKIGVKNLGFSFTIMDENSSEIKKVYNLSKELNVELALALVQNSQIYFKKTNNNITSPTPIQEGLAYIIASELKSSSPKRWLRAYYNYGLLFYLINKKRLLPSGAGRDSLFVSATGDIYPSNLIDLKMGNLDKENLDKIWSSPKAKEVREKIKQDKIQESWIICTLRGQMKKNLLKVIFWIIKNKFFKNAHPSN